MALFAQRVLLALVEGGVTRDEAYRVVQTLAQEALGRRAAPRAAYGGCAPDLRSTSRRSSITRRSSATRMGLSARRDAITSAGAAVAR
jgi:adenylosuccinate lyase